MSLTRRLTAARSVAGYDLVDRFQKDSGSTAAFAASAEDWQHLRYQEQKRAEYCLAVVMLRQLVLAEFEIVSAIAVMLTTREQDEKGHAVGGNGTGAGVIDEHLQELTVQEQDGALVGGAGLVAVAEHFVAAGSAAAAGVPVAVVVAAAAAGPIDA